MRTQLACPLCTRHAIRRKNIKILPSAPKPRLPGRKNVAALVVDHSPRSFSNQAAVVVAPVPFSFCDAILL
jgi:hypothetical protein